MKALYGLKKNAARWHEKLSDTLQFLRYEPSKADPNLWIKYCRQWYEYIATYVDNLLIFSKDPIQVIELLKKEYTLKGVGEPEYYLGENLRKSGFMMEENYGKLQHRHT